MLWSTPVLLHRFFKVSKLLDKKRPGIPPRYYAWKHLQSVVGDKRPKKGAPKPKPSNFARSKVRYARGRPIPMPQPSNNGRKVVLGPDFPVKPEVLARLKEHCRAKLKSSVHTNRTGSKITPETGGNDNGTYGGKCHWCSEWAANKYK